MKKLLAALLAMTMILSSTVLCVTANTTDTITPTESWSTYASTDWYTTDSDSNETTEDTDNNAFTIKTAADLAGLAALVTGGNKFSGITINVEATEIDLSAYLWEPIGNNANPFQGVFNGNGVTIKGMYISESPEAADTTNQYALFGVLSTTSADNLTPALRNFNLENCYVNTMNIVKVAAVVGQIYTNQAADIKVENISVSGTVTAGNDVASNVTPAGICSMVTIDNTAATLTIQNVVCDVDLKDISTARGWSATVGGIVGNFNKNTGTVIIQSCVVLGDISSEQMNAGGIVGMAAGAGTQIIRNCFIAGSVTANTTSRGAGGVIGWQAKNSTFTVENCVVVSTLTSTNGTTDPIIALAQDATAVLTVPEGSTNYAIGAGEDGTNYTAISADQINAFSGILKTASNLTDYANVEKTLGNLVTACNAVAKTSGLCALQVSTANTGNTYSVRFIAKLASTDYAKAGIKVTINGVTQTMDTTSVYTAISATNEYGAITEYKAETLGATYLYAAGVYNIPADAENVVITVTPFTTTVDGEENETTVDGEAYKITFSKGVFVGAEKVVNTAA